MSSSNFHYQPASAKPTAAAEVLQQHGRVEFKDQVQEVTTQAALDRMSFPVADAVPISASQVNMEAQLKLEQRNLELQLELERQRAELEQQRAEMEERQRAVKEEPAEAASSGRKSLSKNQKIGIGLLAVLFASTAAIAAFFFLQDKSSPVTNLSPMNPQRINVRTSPAPTFVCESGNCTNSSTFHPVPGPTIGPSPAPTTGPTKNVQPPATLLTSSPSKGQAAAPVRPPTPRPVARPTDTLQFVPPPPRPTARPTEAPVRRPTPARPTARPTEAPVRRPTPRPTARPTEAPVRRPTQRPTARPTDAPVPGPPATQPSTPHADPFSVIDEIEAKIDAQKERANNTVSLFKYKPAAPTNPSPTVLPL